MYRLLLAAERSIAMMIEGYTLCSGRGERGPGNVFYSIRSSPTLTKKVVI